MNIQCPNCDHKYNCEFPRVTEGIHPKTGKNIVYDPEHDQYFGRCPDESCQSLTDEPIVGRPR